MHLSVSLAILGAAAPSIAADLVVPEKLYTGVNRPIIVQIHEPLAGPQLDPQPPAPTDPAPAAPPVGPEPPAPPDTPGPVPAPDAPSAPQVEIALIDPMTGLVVDRASADFGRADLAAMFPLLWTTRRPRTLCAQVFIDDVARGPACILEPLVTPVRSADALSARAANAIRTGNTAFLATLVGLSQAARDDLARQVDTSTPTEEVYSGMRCYTDRLIELDTTFGTLLLGLRPDAAPNTCFAIRGLVEGGLYEGVPFHRIIAEDLDGNPYLVQAGDPTGTGLGGPGFHIDFEHSPIEHDFGVVSLARSPEDPNSGGSQFFICLSREACEQLDGSYTAFAEVVDGATTLDAIAAAPVGPIDPSDPSSRHERPIAPPIIRSARLVEAPPADRRPARIVRPVQGPVER